MAKNKHSFRMGRSSNSERVYYKEIEPQFDPNIFNMFPNLEALQIFESDIKYIPPEIGNLTKLRISYYFL